MELINREDLLKWVGEEDIHTPDETWMPAREWVEIIKNAPIIESRPQGKWTDGLDDRGFYNRCNNCGYDNVESYFHHKSDMNYCPKCGAKMEE